MNGKDAMNRLGAHIRGCPQCKASFNAHRTPRWWLSMLYDGVLVEGNAEEDLFCSEECATAAGEERRTLKQEDGVTITYLVKPDEEVT
jgi:hypothetical protein